jgi:hypothetical protein
MREEHDVTGDMAIKEAPDRDRLLWLVIGRRRVNYTLHYSEVQGYML